MLYLKCMAGVKASHEFECKYDVSYFRPEFSCLKGLNVPVYLS